MGNATPISVVGLVGSSGSGKTTLLERMLPVLGAAGWRVAVIKHAGRGFDPEEHGKDSHRAIGGPSSSNARTVETSRRSTSWSPASTRRRSI